MRSAGFEPAMPPLYFSKYIYPQIKNLILIKCLGIAGAKPHEKITVIGMGFG
jgi:hypothetical protein